MDNVLHVVSVSGGKDSTAMSLLALEKHPRETVRFVFADTGNEHELVYEYLDYLEQHLDIQIKRLKVNFDRQIANKRMFIARDKRTKRYKGRKVRWSNKRKRQALAILHPTGNPFLDLCLWKGRFPSRRAQFCTQFLKTQPMQRYQHELADQGYDVISWQGVRRDESPARRDVLQIEQADEHIWFYRPIADWDWRQVFEIHRKYDVKPNPLYKMGQQRVGCMPCINAAKPDIREIAKRFPEHIDRIAEWERLVSQTGRRGGATFFPNLERNPLDHPNIYSVVEWSTTGHGGRQQDWLFADAGNECASSYGLCDGS